MVRQMTEAWQLWEPHLWSSVVYTKTHMRARLSLGANTSVAVSHRLTMNVTSEM